jgi:Secretion system C-terminal sorting domain
VPGATTYFIELNTDPNFGAGTADMKSSSNPTIAFSLNFDTKYYARVKTNLLDVWGTKLKSFTTGSPTSLAYITSPKDGGTGVPSTVKVTSNPVPSATSYTIELNTSSDFSGTKLELTSSSRTKTFSGLATFTTYYARVSTNAAPGEWGPARSFTTINPSARSSSDWMGEEVEEEELKFETGVNIYPVPFRQTLNIHVQTLKQDALLVNFYNLQGSQVHSFQGLTNRVEEIDGEAMAPGVYLLKIITNEGVTIKKILKE